MGAAIIDDDDNFVQIRPSERRVLRNGSEQRLWKLVIEGGDNDVGLRIEIVVRTLPLGNLSRDGGHR